MLIPPLLKSKQAQTGILLAMVDAATSNISRIYAYSIFLSTYPPHWLIYFIVAKVFFSAFLRRMGFVFLTEDLKKGALIQFVIFIIVFIACILSLPIHAYFLPFIVSVIIASIPELSTIICWNLLSISFGMREYKEFIGYGNQAAFAGILISSFLVPLLVLFFYNTVLLFFTIFLLALGAVLIYQLPIQKQEKKPVGHRNKTPSEPSQDPLYYYMLLFSIIVATIMVISQYLMKTEVSLFYHHGRLSAFLGYFSGLTCIIGFILASTSQRVVKYFGLEALLYATALVSFFFAGLVIILPGLWSFVLFAGVQVVFSLSYGMYSTEAILNIFPPSIRVVAKANIKSTSKIISALLLFVFTMGSTHIDYITYFIPLSCLIAIYMAYKIKQSYKATLQAESSFKRYNVLDAISSSTAPIFKEIAINSIKSRDAYSVFYGLDLLYRLHLKECPKAFYPLLHHQDPRIRSAAIDFIIQEKNTAALSFLIKQLSIEKDRGLRFKLFETIAGMDFDTALKLSKNLPEKIFETVLTQINLLRDDPETFTPLLPLIKLVDDPDVQVRKMIAFLIGTFNIKALSESLSHLINDSNEAVSDEALRSAGRNKMISLLPAITNQLLNRKGAYVPYLTIIALGSDALPYLFSNVFNPKTCGTYIRTIAAIPGFKAEQMLIEIVNQGSVFMRTLAAQYLNERACKMILSDEIKTKAHRFAEQECAIIIQLNRKLKKPLSEHVRVEILLRIELAKKRFLQWLAVLTKSREVNRVTTSLLESNESITPLIFDKAIELLEIYIRDKSIQNEIDYIFENKRFDLSAIAPYSYQDTWLEKIMGTPMNEPNQKYPALSIVFELRAVQLFKDLPAEVLMAIAEEIEYCFFSPGDLIFSENDTADGLYCVSQGVVETTRGGANLATIEQHGFFGELALLDEEKRVASATAKTACSLIFIEKDLFNRIANDVPDVLRAVVKVILTYLRKNLDKQ